MLNRSRQTVITLSIALCALVPILVLGDAPYTLIKLANKSGIADEKVFFIAHGSLPENGAHCFLQFDAEGIGACIPVTSHTLPSTYSYSIAEFQSKTLHIPLIDAGRLYVSLGYDLALYTNLDKEGNVTIVSPTGFNPKTPSHYTLHDKIEFTYANNGFFINPTAVDFFTLPLQITNQEATGHLKASGLSLSHARIYEGIHQMLKDDGSASKAAWQKLFVNFNDNGTITPLRFMAPGKAMVIEDPPNPASFDVHYLDNKPAYGFDYIRFVWDHYKTHTLLVDVGPLLGGLLTGQVNANDVFEFKNASGTIVPLLMPENSIPFFAGGVGTFDHENKTAKAIVVREFTAAFTVGLLPAPNGTVLGKPACSSANYFEQNKSKYYSNNPVIGRDDGPWYDLYGKALHFFEQPIYTFAYDDALCQDGTMHVAKGIEEPTVITIGDMSGITIPDPYTKKFYPEVFLDISIERTVTYRGVPMSGGVFNIKNVTTPLLVYIDDDPRPLEIYIEHPLIVMEPYSISAYGILIDPATALIKFPGGTWE